VIRLKVKKWGEPADGIGETKTIFHASGSGHGPMTVAKVTILRFPLKARHFWRSCD
jgi:hypothetical protein